MNPVQSKTGGEFLLPQISDSYKIHQYHVEPPHLHQLRVIRKIQDPISRELAFHGNIRRIRRSPQFFQNLPGGSRDGNAGQGTNSGRDKTKPSANGGFGFGGKLGINIFSSSHSRNIII